MLWILKSHIFTYILNTVLAIRIYIIVWVVGQHKGHQHCHEADCHLDEVDWLHFCEGDDDAKEGRANKACVC